MGKKLVVFSVALFLSFTCFASKGKDIRLSIKGDGTFLSHGGAIYQATKNTPNCTESWFDEGGAYVTMSKRIYPTFEAINGIILLPYFYESHCNYERIGGAYLNFTTSEVLTSYNVVDVFEGDAETHSEQVVACKIILSGPNNDEEMVSCVGGVVTDANGYASISVWY